MRRVSEGEGECEGESEKHKLDGKRDTTAWRLQVEVALLGEEPLPKRRVRISLSLFPRVLSFAGTSFFESGFSSL